MPKKIISTFGTHIITLKGSAYSAETTMSRARTTHDGTHDGETGGANGA